MANISEQLSSQIITDTLNREENPLAGNWSLMNPGFAKGKCQSGPPIGYTPTSSFATGPDATYWSLEPFSTSDGKYIAARFTITRLGTSTNRQTGLWVCRDQASPVTTQNGYYLRVEKTAVASQLKFTLERIDSGVPTVLTELLSTEYKEGSRIAIVVGSGKVQMWASKEEGTTFEEKLTFSDSTYTSGYSCLMARGSSEFIVKDFATSAFSLSSITVVPKSASRGLVMR